MNINYYINTKYDTYQTRKDGTTVVRIAVVLNNGAGPMFAVMNAVETGKLQIQTFADASSIHLYGLTDTNNYSYDDFVNDVLPNLNSDIREALYDCTKHLERSFKNCAMKNHLPGATQAEVYTDLRKFYSSIQPKLRGGNVSAQTAPAVKSAEKLDLSDCEWNESVDAVSMPPEVLNRLVSRLNENIVNGEVVIEGDTAYRIIDNGNGAVLQSTRDVEKVKAVLKAGITPNHAPKTPVIRRATKQVVFVKDNSNFEGIFEAGMFYDMVKSENGYTTLLGLDGEKHELSNKRLEFVDVYSLPPETSKAEVVA